MAEARRDAGAEVLDVIARRWSPRAFDAARPVEPEKLRTLLEAARWAPSCFGDEPWRYIVCDRFGNDAAWQALFGCLAEKNRLWAKNAPLLMVSFADSEFRQSGKPNRWGQHDTGAASVSLCLQATALGLASHQMGGFDAEAVRQAFGVPERFMPMSVIAVGYRGSVEELAEDFVALEEGERGRRPVGELFFAGAWGKGVA